MRLLELHISLHTDHSVRSIMSFRKIVTAGRAGAFVGPDGKTLPVPENLPNAHMRLFGGAQYHRAMAEFRNGIGQLTCPDISREEIVNACGIDDFHDGVNYTRTACVIAVSKARDVFEPFLHQVGLMV